MDEFCEFQLRRMQDTEQQILTAVVRHLLEQITRRPESQPGHTVRFAHRMRLIERVKRA